MSKMKERRSISWHLKNLGDLPVSYTDAIVEDKPSATDVKRNPRGITVNRYLAAKLIKDTAVKEQPGFYALVMERTEGKVPDVRVNLQGEDIVTRLEAARARLALPASSAQIIDSDPTTQELVHTAPNASCDIAMTSSTTSVVLDTGRVDAPTSSVKDVTPRVKRLAVPTPGPDPGTIEGRGGNGEPTPSALQSWLDSPSRQRTRKNSAKSPRNK